MNFNIKDYTKVVDKLNLFIDINMKRQVEDGTHLFQYNNKTYMLTDNGGETNVILINDSSFSIPHTSHSIEVTPKVLAYRIATYLEKNYSEINWKVNQNTIKKSKNKYNVNDIEIINYTAKKEVA
jgi:hypothetical protein